MRSQKHLAVHKGNSAFNLIQMQPLEHQGIPSTNLVPLISMSLLQKEQVCTNIQKGDPFSMFVRTYLFWWWILSVAGLNTPKDVKQCHENGKHMHFLQVLYSQTRPKSPYSF